MKVDVVRIADLESLEARREMNVGDDGSLYVRAIPAGSSKASRFT